MLTPPLIVNPLHLSANGVSRAMNKKLFNGVRDKLDNAFFPVFYSHVLVLVCYFFTCCLVVMHLIPFDATALSFPHFPVIA